MATPFRTGEERTLRAVPVAVPLLLALALALQNEPLNSADWLTSRAEVLHSMKCTGAFPSHDDKIDFPFVDDP